MLKKKIVFFFFVPHALTKLNFQLVNHSLVETSLLSACNLEDEGYNCSGS